MSQKAPTIKLGGAPYEDATQASIHYQTPALLKVMFRITTRIVWKIELLLYSERWTEHECDAKPAKIINSACTDW